MTFFKNSQPFAREELRFFVREFSVGKLELIKKEHPLV